jgi:hypothetical protein
VADTEPAVAPAQLVASIKADLTGLVTDHVDLAKLEMQDTAKQGGIGAGLIAAAVGLVVLAGVLLSFALAYGIATLFGWPTWTGFVIVGVLYLLVAGLLGLLARNRFRQITPPQRTVASLRQTLASLQGTAQAGR